MRYPEFLSSVPRGRERRRDQVFLRLVRAAAESSCNYANLYEAARDGRELLHDLRGAEERIDVPHPGESPHALDDAARRLSVRILEGLEPLPSLSRLPGLLQEVEAPWDEPSVDGLPVPTLRRLAELAVEKVNPSEITGAGWPAYVLPENHGAREREALHLVEDAERAIESGRDPTALLEGVAAMAVLQRYWSRTDWSLRTWSRLQRLVVASRRLFPAGERLARVLASERVDEELASVILDGPPAVAAIPTDGADEEWDEVAPLLRAMCIGDEVNADAPPPTALMTFAGRAFRLAFQGGAARRFMKGPGGPAGWLPHRNYVFRMGRAAFSDAWRVAAENSLEVVLHGDPPPSDLSAAVCAGLALGHLGLRHDPTHAGKYCVDLRRVLASNGIDPLLVAAGNDLLSVIQRALPNREGVPLCESIPEDRLLEALLRILPAARTPVSAGDGRTPSELDSVLIRHGETWEIRFRGRRSTLPHLEGLSIVATLLQHPGRDYAAAELCGYPAVESAGGELIDDAGLKALRDRLSDAEELGKIEEAAMLKEEIRAAHRPGRRRRKELSSSGDKARKRLQALHARFMRKLESIHREAHDHFSKYVRIGVVCGYRPESNSPNWFVAPHAPDRRRKQE